MKNLLYPQWNGLKIVESEYLKDGAGYVAMDTAFFSHNDFVKLIFKMCEFDDVVKYLAQLSLDKLYHKIDMAGQEMEKFISKLFIQSIKELSNGKCNNQ